MKKLFKSFILLICVLFIICGIIQIVELMHVNNAVYSQPITISAATFVGIGIVMFCAFILSITILIYWNN